MLASLTFYVQKYKAGAKLKGRIIPINLEAPPYEADFEIDGFSYHLIFGPQINGWFLCVPNWNIGAELAHPSDTFWNFESISRSGTKKSTAHYISEALSEIIEFI